MGQQDNNTLEQQARLEEFRALREQMLYTLRSRIWGVVSYVLIAGAIFAFKPDTPAPDTLPPAKYLALILLALPFLWYTIYLERMRVRIEAYIMVVLEHAVPGLAWQHHELNWRHKNPEGSRKLFRWFYILSMTGVYDIIAGFSLCLAFPAKQPVPLWQQVTAILAILFIAETHHRLNKVFSHQKDYRKIFDSAPSPFPPVCSRCITRLRDHDH